MSRRHASGHGRAETRPLAAGLVALSVSASLVACEAEETVPFETVSIRIDARDPFSSRPEGNLGVALLWTTTSTIFASSEVLLGRDDNTVDMPLERIIPRPANLFFAEFGLARETVAVHVPRIAIFRDDDGSGGFTPWELSKDPPDQIFAVNGQGATSVAVVLNFEDAFSRLTASDVNTYYEVTEGIHTPFLRFRGATSTLTPDEVALSGPPVLSMYFEDSEVPARDIRCLNIRRFQTEPLLEPIAAAGTSSQSFNIMIDDRVDAASICGLTTPDCASVDINTVTATIPDDLKTAGRRVLTRCRASSNFESLVTLEAELKCNRDCDCGWREQYRALVVQTSSIPEDWPCGNEVPICSSPLPLFQIDESCE